MEIKYEKTQGIITYIKRISPEIISEETYLVAINKTQPLIINANNYKDIQIISDRGVSSSNKYLKYKQKYLKLKGLIN